MSATQTRVQPVPPVSVIEQEFEFDIRRTKFADDQAPINASALKEQLSRLLYEAGDEFQGKYEVSIAAIWDTDKSGYFSWKTHSCGQEGIGFLIGHTFDGDIRYPGRSGSIKAPAHVDTEELCAALLGRRLLKKLPPKLQLVKEVVAMQNPPSTKDEGDTHRLAKVVHTKLRQQARRDAALDRCQALARENAEIEVKLAARPDFEAAVLAKLTELGF